jgi:hypothetical protein
MILYGLADYHVLKVIEFYATPEEAEAALVAVLKDEPSFAEILSVVTVDFGDCLSRN